MHKENYYIYAQTMNGKTQYGLVVGAYVPDYMNGIIKKHELTRRDKEEDRMKHVRVNNANIEPVFFAYPDNAKLDAIIREVHGRTSLFTTLSLRVMASDILSGLLTRTKISLQLLQNLLKCRHYILPTGIIVPLLLLW